MVDANSARNPKLTGTSEDGTLAAVWESAGKYRVKISLDGGISWSPSPLEFQSASQNIDPATDLMDLIALPCGSAGLLTVESQNKLFLRFINVLEGKVVSAQLIQNTSPLKKFQFFRDDYRLKVLVLDQQGSLKALSLP